MNMNIGIILSAGKGTRINSTSRNKTSIIFHGKPIIRYGIKIFLKNTEKTLIVVGYHKDSITSSLPSSRKLLTCEQKSLLGTGHAVKTAVEFIEKKRLKPKNILVGYGDHMMFYTNKNIKDLLNMHKKKKPSITLVSVFYEKPNELAWGRILRDKKNKIIDIREQKVASEKEKEIKETNAGLYCFDYKFIKKYIGKLKKNRISGEYYLTDMIKIADKHGKTIESIVLPFKNVGIGINTRKQLKQSKNLFRILEKNKYNYVKK